MHNSPNYKLFLGAMAILEFFDKEFSEVHQEFGISRSEWTLLTQDKLWSRAESAQATAILDKVMSGSLVHAGLGQVQLPAQYAAAAIARFVSPRNWLVASHAGRQYIDGLKAIADDAEGARQIVSAERLFALITVCYDEHDDICYGSSIRKGDMIDVQAREKARKAKAT